MYKIMPWDGSRASGEENASAKKKLINRPITGLSDIYEGTLSAFELYYCAVRCALICQFPRCKDAPNLQEELLVIRDILRQLPCGETVKAERKLGDILEGEPSPEFLIEILFELAEYAAHLLPPPRRLDWRIRWRDGTPLLFIDDFKAKTRDQDIEAWKRLLVEDQLDRIGPKVHWYLDQNAQPNGYQFFEEIWQCPHYPYFNCILSLGHDIWTWRYDRSRMPIARQLEPLTREYWATMHDWAHLHFFDQQTRRKRRRTVDEETGTIRIAIGIEDMVRIDLMAYAEGLHDELRTFMLANVDELFDEREPRLLPDFSLSTPDERRSLEEWHKSCVDDHPECFDKMWERIRIAEDLDAMRKLKKAATKSSPETEQTERETREPFSPLERDILECLKGKLLTRGELLAAMGRTGQYVQSLDRVIGPSSRLRKEGLVKKHSSGRGYYSVNEPPKESS